MPGGRGTDRKTERADQKAMRHDVVRTDLQAGPRRPAR